MEKILLITILIISIILIALIIKQINLLNFSIDKSKKKIKEQSSRINALSQINRELIERSAEINKESYQVYCKLSKLELEKKNLDRKLEEKEEELERIYIAQKRYR